MAPGSQSAFLSSTVCRPIEWCCWHTRSARRRCARNLWLLEGATQVVHMHGALGGRNPLLSECSKVESSVPSGPGSTVICERWSITCMGRRTRVRMP